MGLFRIKIKKTKPRKHTVHGAFKTLFRWQATGNNSLEFPKSKLILTNFV